MSNLCQQLTWFILLTFLYSEKVKSKKSDLISALIALKWKIPALEQRGWYWSSSCRHKSRHWATGPTGNSGGETGGSMSVMEPLVTQRPWQEGGGFDCLLLFFSARCGKWGCWCWVTAPWKADGTSAVAVLTFQTLVSSLPVRSPVVPAHSINLLSFIFRCCAVSSSYSAIFRLDGVRPTARPEPNLWKDRLLFWAKLL